MHGPVNDSDAVIVDLLQPVFRPAGLKPFGEDAFLVRIFHEKTAGEGQMTDGPRIPKIDPLGVFIQAQFYHVDYFFNRFVGFQFHVCILIPDGLLSLSDL